MPPWGFWPLAFVGVMVFEIALGSNPSRGDRFVIGMSFGLSWMFMGMGWMWFLTVPGYIAAGVIFATFHAVAAVAAPTGRWRVIGRPAAHTLVEALRLTFPFGGVPLATIGIGQVSGPLDSMARVGGVILLTWAVFQVGFALAGPAPFVPATVQRVRANARSAPQGVVAIGVIVLIWIASAFAPSGVDIDTAPVTIAVVQGGGRQGTRALDVPSALVTQVHLDATRTIEPDDELDMVLWPENVIDINDEPFEGSEINALVAAEAERLGVPLVVGITEDADQTGIGPDGKITNAQVVVLPDGSVTSRFDKVRRVPFGEYVPLRGLLEAFGAPIDQIPTDAVAGTEPAVVDLPDGTRLGVVISWEVFFGDRARDGAERDAAIVINPTNGASYTGTQLQTQQIASSRLRAIETGRWIVQGAPTGFSAFISPDGLVFQRTEISEQAVIVMDVPPRTGTTWYTSLGDGPWVVAMVLLLAMARWFATPRREKLADPDLRREPAR